MRPENYASVSMARRVTSVNTLGTVVQTASHIVSIIIPLPPVSVRNNNLQTYVRRHATTTIWTPVRRRVPPIQHWALFVPPHVLTIHRIWPRVPPRVLTIHQISRHARLCVRPTGRTLPHVLPFVPMIPQMLLPVQVPVQPPTRPPANTRARPTTRTRQHVGLRACLTARMRLHVLPHAHPPTTTHLTS